MKLDNIHKPFKVTQNRVFNEYITKLNGLVNSRASHLLMEGKKVVVTVDLGDEKDAIDEIKQYIDQSRGQKGYIDKEAKDKFVEQAKSIGQFDNAEWLKQIINGLKQAGVQGVNQISEGDRPVTMNEIRKLISMLVTLINK